MTSCRRLYFVTDVHNYRPHLHQQVDGPPQVLLDHVGDQSDPAELAQLVGSEIKVKFDLNDFTNYGFAPLDKAYWQATEITNMLQVAGARFRLNHFAGSPEEHIRTVTCAKMTDIETAIDRHYPMANPFFRSEVRTGRVWRAELGLYNNMNNPYFRAG